MSDPASAHAVLFDLDGTLVDTAPDLVDALFRTCDELGATRPSFDAARRQVANGGLGLVRLAFGDQDPDAERVAHRRFLARYAERIAVHSRVFEPLESTINALRVPWGIVTNKPAGLTAALLAGLGLRPTDGCVVSGDTLPVRKPDPAPLQLAARMLDVAPQGCLYAGDHRRDIEAAHSAGMTAIAVAYGYNVEGDKAEDWGADLLCRKAADLAALLGPLTTTRGAL